MQTLHFVSIWLHILAAAIWIGGMVFLGVVLIPVLRDRSLAARYGELIHRTGTRFRNVGWACLLLLVVTGFVNLMRWGIGLDRLVRPEVWASPWGKTLAVKLTLVGLILALSATHDF